MKLLSIPIILFFMLEPMSMPANFVDTSKQTNIIITRDKMTIETVLPYGKIPHCIILKDGLNKGYYALNDNQSFSYEIINN